MRSKQKSTGDEMPDYLAGDEHARGEWRRLRSALERVGTWSVDDASMVEATCSAYSEYRKASAALAETGPTYQTEAGRIFASPAATISADAWRRWHAGLQSLGLSPTSRKRATRPERAVVNPVMARYLPNDSGDARDYFSTAMENK